MREVDGMKDHEHMRHRPDMYIGDVTTKPTETYIFNVDEGIITYDTVDAYNNAVVQLVRESTSNAADQIFHCELEGKDRRIDLNIDESTISVTNYGAPMLIDFNKSGKVSGRMIPEMCFLDARTGSNFTATKSAGVGKNGYGATLCVVYAKYFCAEIVDVEKNRYFKLTCTRNGTKVRKIVWPEPEVDENGVWYMPTCEDVCPHFESRRSYTKVTMEPDFDVDYCATLDKDMFVPSIVTANGKTIEATHMFKKIESISDKFRNAIFVHCLGFAMHNIQLRLNGTIIHAQKFSAFVKFLYAGITLGNAETAGKTKKPKIKAKTKAKARARATIEGDNADNDEGSTGDILIFKEVRGETTIRIAIVNTLRCMPPFGFVNGLFINKGMHIKIVQAALAKVVAAVKSKIKITPRDVQNAVTLCVSIEGPEAKYKNQSKDELLSIDGKASLTLKCLADVFETIKEWNCIKRILQNAEAKEVMSELGKKQVNILDGYLPANKLGLSAGLLLGEGKSTTSFLNKYRESVEGGMDNFGLMVARGVPLNPINKTDLELINNAVFKTLIRIMGLSFEKTYEEDSDLVGMRYGSVIIAADADEDGLHIACLFIAFFQYRWPALVSRGFVRILRTPVIIVYKGESVVNKYFTEPEFMENQHNYDSKFHIKYLKGLGAYSDDEIQLSAQSSPVVYVMNTEETTTLMLVVFNPSQIKQRKDHILKYVDTCSDTARQFKSTDLGKLVQKRYYDKILKSDAVVFSLSAIRRFLPHDRDGLKPGQRMVVAWCLEHTQFGKKCTSIKVAQLAGKISADQQYHHGPTSMEGTIMKMAQQYVGRCNMAFLSTDGQAGSRLSTDSASSPRYVGVKVAPWVQHAYLKKLYRCVPRRNVEGHVVEPLFVPCLLPMIVINGGKGIASGWSSTMPAHNPKQVLAWLIQRTICNTPKQKICVWWNGYIGKINYGKELSVSSAHIDENGETILETETVSRGYIAYGCRETVKGDTIITEIPPGVTYMQFVANLQELQENKLIKGFRNNTKGNSPYFVIHGAKSLTNKELMLVEQKSLTNFTFMHDRGQVRRFLSVVEYMEYYYKIMLEVYEKNKLLEIEEMELEVAEIRQKIKYIKLCLDGLKPTELTEAEYIDILKQNSLELKVIDKVKDRDKTTNNYVKLFEIKASLKQAIIEHQKIIVSDVYREDLLKLKRHV